MKERIQKIIAARGVASRRSAEAMIEQGRVSCNGIICKLGDTAEENDIICLDGKPLPAPPKTIYIMLHKPKGYVTTLSDEKGRANAFQLVADCGQRVYPVGRLDKDSEGLLLFTNDGEFANHMMHPRNEVDKVYMTDVKGFSLHNLEGLKKSIVLDGYRIAPPKVELVESNGDFARLSITIHEGRNRQVRRMCARAGMAVKRLVRIQEGALHLADLPCGAWRMLTDEEILALKKEIK